METSLSSRNDFPYFSPHEEKRLCSATISSEFARVCNGTHFKQEMQRVVISFCKQTGLPYTAEQVGNLASAIASEYFNERKHAS
ncbi:MAG: hypothetical protein IJ131_00810 [Eggerthellaceae bacterium]|nr:hypothetical protein [Eggerthellaceae bacterium]